MHVDIRSLDNGSLIEGDVCIVGAGAAGISMALDWIGSMKRVLLLEAGGFDYDAQMQDLYRGEIVGEPYFPLQAARLHFFGGTTGHWGGFCAPLDPIDFEQRKWVENSGWPISLDDLTDYYARAQNVLELGPYDYSSDYWRARDPELRQLSLGEAFWTKMWQFSPPTRFGTRYRDSIVNAKDVHLYTHATVSRVLANEAGSLVESVLIKTMDGAEHTVRARQYVLACGAIQNARLLLASNGLGNENDVVGRYFMEHIEIPGANLRFFEPKSLKMYVALPRVAGADTPARGELALSADTQRSNEILNGTASIEPGSWGENIASTFQTFTPEVLQQFREAEERGEVPVEPDTPYGLGGEFRLFTRQEQTPNPGSRVTLSEEVDALGMPRTRLDWQLTDLDKRSIRRFYELLGQSVGRLGLGRVQLADWLLDSDDRSWPTFLSGGWHHMGTARISDNPRTGVVDSNCRLHSINNLYVAGSAAFPTAGAPNPTLTLVALTLRLSDHLKQNLNRGQA